MVGLAYSQGNFLMKFTPVYLVFWKLLGHYILTVYSARLCKQGEANI